MKTNTRFIQSVVNSSVSAEVSLPWTRGKRRADFIASRKTQGDLREVSVA
jgi:hypothetical protein